MGPYLSEPITKKSQASGHNHQLSFVASDMQGWRSTMQDAICYNINLPDNNSVFGVFDGHGGCEVSRFTAKHFVYELTKNTRYKRGEYEKGLEETFKRIDDMIVSPYGTEELLKIREASRKNKENQQKKEREGTIAETTGCTANVVLITPTTLYVANAGDSRAVLCRQGKAYALSVDHKPTLPGQAQRIQKAGGAIMNGRINGGVNLSRSFGDYAYKNNKQLSWEEQLVISKPTITATPRNPQDEFIVVGCDGIWDGFGQNHQGLVTMINDSLKETQTITKTVAFVLDKLLAPSATNGQPGTDNMSIVLIYFRKR